MTPAPTAPTARTQAREPRYLMIAINHSNAGFFAYVTFAINQIIEAEKRGLTPVVDFGPWSVDGPNAFYDPAYGESTWDYYFEPVAGVSAAEIHRRLADPDDPLCEEDLVRLSVDELWFLHLGEPDSIYNYPYGRHQGSAGKPQSWYDEQRRRARRVVERYVRVKPEIRAEVDAYVAEHFAGHRVLGIHMRGTDKGTAQAPANLMRVKRPADYYPWIDRYLEAHGPCRIFVATDQRQFVDELRGRYGERVLALDAIRGSSSLNPFQQSDGRNFRKGKEVLIDCLLLSHCDFLLKCTSAVGEYAMYFNGALDCIDVNDTGCAPTLGDRASVAWARARFAFRRGWQQLRDSDAPPSERIRQALAYNPVGIAVYMAIERRRFSTSPLAGLLVDLKDRAWAAIFPERAPRELVRHRRRVRRERRGASVFDVSRTAHAELLEVRSDGDLATHFIRVVKGLHLAEAHRLRPVVNIDQPYSAYRDPARGNNVWEYYFEPVSELRAADLDRMDRSGLLMLEPSQQFATTLGDEPRAEGRPGDEERDPGFARRRRVAAGIVERWVRVRPGIEAKVCAFADEHLAPGPVLGVHLRGTDWGIDASGARRPGPRRLVEVVEPERYLPAIDATLSAHPDCRLFVATDQQQFLDALVARYGERVAATGARRSTDRRCPARIGSDEGYARGEEVLVDILLLARCDGLLRCASAVGEVASWFAPEVPVVDLSCEDGAGGVDLAPSGRRDAPRAARDVRVGA